MHLKSTSLPRRPLANQQLSWSGDDRMRVEAHILQTKAIGIAIIVIRKKVCLDAAGITFTTTRSALPRDAIR